MKKLFIVLLLTGIFACEKKKDKVEVPEPLIVVPTAKTSAMNANVNGNAWEITNNKTATPNMAQSVYGKNPKQYVFGGYTHPTLNRHSIHVGFIYSTGTYSLGAFTNYYALYYDSTGTSYPAKTGTINIVNVDTSHVKSATGCDKFKATFSFITSPVAGKSFTIEQGAIDFEAN